MKHMYAWFVISAIAGTCAIGLAVSPQETSVLTNPPQPIRLGTTNQPAPVGNTNQPVRLGTANQPIRFGKTNQTSRTSTNAILPPMYQDTISNLHDISGTDAINHSNDNLTPNNAVTTNSPPFHVPPK